VQGPQVEALNFDKFLAQSYHVGLASNRVGVRLEGEPMPHTLSLPSEPAVPGAIQIPPDGQPIVLGPDGPTIGGYPKVAVVIDADLDQVGRLRPSDTVRFRLVSLHEARIAKARADAERTMRCAELRLTLT
jgi:allophanate hydrolase subunit 2